MQNIKLLIVDDHLLMAEALQSLLQMPGNISVVGKAKDGNEALERLKNTQVDLVLMDYGLPGMNGSEVTRLIREDFPSVKVLALSMYDDATCISDMIQAGAAGYVLKSNGISALTEAIQKAVKGEHYLAPEVTAAIIRKAGRKKPIYPSHPFPSHIRLTVREKEIIQLLVMGMSNKQIAEKLNISLLTVKTHRKHLNQKLGIKNIAGLVRYYLENNPLNPS